MPKIVDHEERRQTVMTATWRVIARQGIEGTTIREIARESSCSTGALAHYFSNKDDILRSALEYADARIAERIVALAAELPPGAALREVLAQALPLDDDRTIELTLDVNFWARALNHHRLRAQQHGDHDRWRAVVRDLVERAVEAGELHTVEGVDDVCDLLVAFVDGLGLQALVYPELVTPARVEFLLDAQLAAVGMAGALARVSRPFDQEVRHR